MPSGFWGLNDTGKNALGRMGEIPEWLYQMMIKSQARGDDQYGIGKGQLDQLNAYLRSVLERGFGSPEDIWGYGKQALPGIEEVISNRQGKLQGLEQMLGSLPGWQSVRDEIGGNLDTMGGAIGSQYDAQQQALREAYDRMTGITDTSNEDFVNALKGTYGTVKGGVDDLYGYLRNLSGGTFDDLLGRSDTAYSDLIGETRGTYGKAQEGLKRLLPGGDFRAAASARAFAPAMAAASRRMRTAGIDPNSPEASNMLQRVDAARGRSMDDILGNSYSDFVNRQNELLLGGNRDVANLTLGGLQNRQGLSLGKFGSESGLSREQGGLMRGLQLDEGSTFRNQILRNAGQKMGLEQFYDAGNRGNMDTAFTRSMGVMDKRNELVQLARSMGIQDLGLAQQIADLFNQADLQGLNLKDMQFQRGVEGIGRENAERNAAAQGIGNLGTNAMNRSMTYQQMMGQFGNDAYNKYLQDYGLESQNAGWGKKLLGGIGAGALNLIPGVGPALSAAVSGAMGGGGTNPWAKVFSRGGVSSGPSIYGNIPQFDWDSYLGNMPVYQPPRVGGGR